MKQFLVAVITASILFIGNSYGQGVDAQVKASLDFVELIHEVASWVRGGLSRHDEKEIKRIEESVPKLSGQLSTQAGEKNALAKYLMSYGAGTDKRKFEYDYRKKVQQLNQQLRDIQRTINEMDPKWKGNNPMANFNVSSAVAQKQLFLQEYGMPEDLFEVNLTELANAYKNEAYNLLQASIEISNSLKEHNNGVEKNASR